MGKTIGIVNQKGGAGKTTTTIEVASNLSRYEKRVLVIDIDSQVGLTHYVPADESRPSLYEVLHGEISIDDAIQHLDNFDVITASGDLSKADKEFVDYDDVFLLKDIIEIIQDRYEYILVDTGPSRTILLNMVYVASDYIIAPSVADAGNIFGIEKLYKDLLDVRSGKRPISHARIIALLLNMFQGNQVNDQVILEQLQELASQMEEDPIVQTIRIYTGVKACKSLKETISEYDKNSNAAVDFKNFTWDLLQKMEEIA